MKNYHALWEKDIVYDEIVVFVENDGVICGHLAFKPKEVLEIKDRKGEILVDGVDYLVDGVRIVLKNSKFSYFEEEWLKNKNVPNIPNENDLYKIEGALLFDPKYLRERQFLVSYKKKSNEFVEFLPKKVLLNNTKNKLLKAKRLKIALFGDSISNAANSSWEIGFSGYEHYFDKVCREIGNLYDASVEYINISRSGYGTEWALSAVDDKLNGTNVDVVVIAFGMNDAPAGLNAKSFKENISELMQRIRAVLPDAEFILVAPPIPNPDSPSVSAGQESYYEKLNEMQCDGVTVLNCTIVSQFLLKNKKYVEISGNNINHPNDFVYEIFADMYIKLFEKLK